jgi:carotenoid cleavage dioxygenase
VFHGTNAFRNRHDVVIDVSRLPTMFAPGGDINTNDVRRWTVNTAGPSLTWKEEVTIDRPFDLPTIDRRLAGRQQRYAWYTTTRPWGDAFQFAGVIRHDFTTGADDVWEPDAAESAGEGLYVAEGDEGDGWVLTFVYDARRDASDLAVFDASTISAGPVARVHLPRRVPYGFHATWVPS